MKDQGTFRSIAAELVRRIEDRELRAGQMLPSESALSSEFAVARGTIRAALLMLEERGLVEVVPGKGRRVVGIGQSATTPTTAYERVATDLRRRIAAGEFDPSTALPSEAALIAEYGVSRTTARKAYELLKSDGVVVVHQGAGAFIRST